MFPALFLLLAYICFLRSAWILCLVLLFTSAYISCALALSALGIRRCLFVSAFLYFSNCTYLIWDQLVFLTTWGAGILCILPIRSNCSLFIYFLQNLISVSLFVLYRYLTLLVHVFGYLWEVCCLTISFLFFLTFSLMFASKTCACCSFILVSCRILVNFL